MIRTLNDNSNRNIKIAVIASCAVIAILVSVFLLVTVSRNTTPEPATTSTEFTIPTSNIRIIDMGFVGETEILCDKNREITKVWPKQVVEYGDCKLSAFGRIKGTKKVLVTVDKSPETEEVTKITIAPLP